jgi:hypothetical protein
MENEEKQEDDEEEDHTEGEKSEVEHIRMEKNCD